MTAIVRQAVPADEEALFDLLLALHRGGLGAAFPYDHAKVVAALQHGTRQRGGIIGVIDAPDREGFIVASVGLLVEEWWWSRCCFLEERWCFVRPEYRRGTDYFAALKAFSEDCRRQMATSQAEPFVLESSFVEADSYVVRLKERLWRRWGRKVGGVFISGF